MKYLRFVPLLIGGLLAVVVSIDLLGQAAAQLAQAAGAVLLWAAWVGGPLVYALCLALLAREKPARIVFDLALVGLTVMDAVAAVASLLPFLSGRGLMFYVPVVQYCGLTGLLGLVMLVRAGIPELAKKGASGTFHLP